MIKQIGLPLRGRPILLITRMITDRIGLHSVLLPLISMMKFHTLEAPRAQCLLYKDALFFRFPSKYRVKDEHSET